MGQAYKTCDKEVGWLPADLFNCTSLPFVDLRETVLQQKSNFKNKKILFRKLISISAATIGSRQFEPQPIHFRATGSTAVQSHESQFEIVRQ